VTLDNLPPIALEPAFRDRITVQTGVVRLPD
jgi:hydroxybutyrate-dimer hydrolase